MFELLGICLALASFFAINLAAAIVVTLVWRVAAQRASRWRAGSRAQFIFALRLTPSVLAAIGVGIFFLPAYLNYEPRTSSEVVGYKLAALALLAIIGAALAIGRAVSALIATHRLRRTWLAASKETSLRGVTVRSYQMAHSFPIIAVIGVIRPTIFIAEQVLATLTPAELSAAVAHEHGHLSARDNFKRGLLRACRDILLIPVGQSLERAWLESAESAADEFAAQTSSEVALNLASALVKIARLVPIGARAETPLAAFLVGDETRGIKARVRRLLEIASGCVDSPIHHFRTRAFHTTIVLAGVLVALLATNSHVLITVHGLVERIVYLLS
jgi:Zn-dependent protease with chaperone function